MIVVDTNIVSEMMKPYPSQSVITWLEHQEPTKLFITTITIAEISYGINALPGGNRRNTLETAFSMALNEAFKHRILSFDEAAAHHYGKIMSRRKELGRPLSVPDGQIAAIARSHCTALATRNIRDFSQCDIDLINPFN